MIAQTVETAPKRKYRIRFSDGSFEEVTADTLCKPNTVPEGTINEESPLREAFGLDCRYELVFVPIRNTFSDEEATAFLTDKAVIGEPKTILLNQCSGETWLLRRYKWEPMEVGP